MKPYDIWKHFITTFSIQSKKYMSITLYMNQTSPQYINSPVLSKLANTFVSRKSSLKNLHKFTGASM